MKKKIFLLSLISTFFTSLFANNVFAQGTTGEGIGEMLYNIFGWIGKIDLTKVGVSDQSTFYAKVILWILIFTLLYFGGKWTIFKQSNKLAGTVAALIALITIVAVPTDLLAKTLQTYATVVLFAIIGLPILGICLAKKFLGETFSDQPKLYHGVSAISFWLILVIMRNMNEALVKNYNLFKYTQWFGFAFVVVELLMIYHIIRIFAGAGSTGREAREALGNAGGLRGVGKEEWDSLKKALFGKEKAELKYELREFATLEDVKKALQQKDLEKAKDILRRDVRIIRKMDAKREEIRKYVDNKFLKADPSKRTEVANILNIIRINSNIIRKNVSDARDVLTSTRGNYLDDSNRLIDEAIEANKALVAETEKLKNL
ncbi:MAG: hypothetical protein KAU20_06060 [Nanoarchaeota archaeon]|nr:hypothetical protein [Nanoarchaeota archaeon]